MKACVYINHIPGYSWKMSDAIMRTIINRKGNSFRSTGNKDNQERKEWNKDKHKEQKLSLVFFFLVMQEVHGTSYKANGSLHQSQRCSHELESNLLHGNLKAA